MKRGNHLFLAAMLCSLTCITASAQTATTYQLKDYKYRTAGYRGLQLDVKLDGHSSNLSKSTTNMTTDGSLNYLQTSSSDAMQKSITMDGTFYFSLLHDDSTTVSGSINGNYENNTRIYKDKFFYQYGYNAGISASTSQSYNSFGAGVGGSGAIGRGRLENVGDAQTALFILEDLYKAGKIGRVEPAVAEKLARLITTIKNRRVFDARNKTMFQLEQIDSFFRANNILKQCDVKTFALINDNLYFSFNNDLTGIPTALHTSLDPVTPAFGETLAYERDPLSLLYALNGTFVNVSSAYDAFGRGQVILRNSSDQSPRFNGTVMYLMVNLGNLAGYNDVHSKTPSIESHNHLGANFSPEIQFDIEKHIAKDIHWQKIYSANVYYVTFNQNNSSAIFPNLPSRFDVAARYGAGYYPNNRTAIEANFMAEVQMTGFKNLNFTPLVDLSISKFINYNTAVKADFSLHFGTSNPSFYATNLNIHLRHYFF